MDGRVAQGAGGVRKVHFVFTDQLPGSADPHLTEILHGAETGLLPEDPLEMGAADGKLLADLTDMQLFRDVSGIVVRDPVQENGIRLGKRRGGRVFFCGRGNILAHETDEQHLQIHADELLAAERLVELPLKTVEGRIIYPHGEVAAAFLGKGGQKPTFLFFAGKNPVGEQGHARRIAVKATGKRRGVTSFAAFKE